MSEVRQAWLEPYVFNLELDVLVSVVVLRIMAEKCSSLVDCILWLEFISLF